MQRSQVPMLLKTWRKALIIILRHLSCLACPKTRVMVSLKKTHVPWANSTFWALSNPKRWRFIYNSAAIWQQTCTQALIIVNSFWTPSLPLKLGQLRKMSLYIWVKWRIFIFNIRWERTAINHLSPGRNLLLIVLVNENISAAYRSAFSI